jgi:uncharacterized membrane protein (UPF0127 family)
MRESRILPLATYVPISMSETDYGLCGNGDLEEVTSVAKERREVFVYNKTRETFLAFRVNVADSVLGRLVGLLGRRSLQRDSGVWIVPGNAVHTIGVMFSFDLVLIDKNFKVVGLRELVRPFTIMRPNLRAESALELPAHSIFCSRTRIGDQLLIERYQAREGVKGNGDGRTAPKSLPLDFAPIGFYGPIIQVPQVSGLDSRHEVKRRVRTPDSSRHPGTETMAAGSEL